MRRGEVSEHWRLGHRRRCRNRLDAQNHLLPRKTALALKRLRDTVDGNVRAIGIVVGALNLQLFDINRRLDFLCAGPDDGPIRATGLHAHIAEHGCQAGPLQKCRRRTAVHHLRSRTRHERAAHAHQGRSGKRKRREHLLPRCSERGARKALLALSWRRVRLRVGVCADDGDQERAACMGGACVGGPKQGRPGKHQQRGASASERGQPHLRGREATNGKWLHR
jgi:hypothetical protein